MDAREDLRTPETRGESFRAVLKAASMTKGDLWANETSVLARLPDLGQDGVNSQGKRTLLGKG